MFIDLHTHTTCSDGTLTPEALVTYARDKGLEAVAITDHDSVSGNGRAVREGESAGVEVIPGVEFSAEYEGTLHILGLYVDSHHEKIEEATETLQKKRRERNLKILQKLHQFGIEIEEEPFRENAYLGRPHIALNLVQAGYAHSIEEAFETFLKRGAPAYVSRERLSPEETVRAIREGGGIAVFAHPVTVPDAEKTVAELLPLGVRGIEVYYPTHSPEQMEYFTMLAQRYGLLITGGSDFHGSHKPDIDLGCMHVPALLLDTLKIEKAHSKKREK